MTHGGFYKHFDSKDALALASAFAEFVGAPGQSDGGNVFVTLRSHCLSREHMTPPGRGCPVAALGPEVARGSARLKTAFGAGVRRMVDAIAGGKGLAAARRAAAMRNFSMLVDRAALHSCSPVAPPTMLPSNRNLMLYVSFESLIAQGDRR